MERINAEGAPAAVGPYSHAIRSGNLIFCSGAIPLCPETSEIVGDEVAGQTEQVFNNMAAVLKSQGIGLGDVVKTTVFLQSMGDFGTMNEVYAKRFGDHKPARSTVEVSKLPLGVLVEIECIAEV